MSPNVAKCHRVSHHFTTTSHGFNTDDIRHVPVTLAWGVLLRHFPCLLLLSWFPYPFILMYNVRATQVGGKTQRAIRIKQPMYLIYYRTVICRPDIPLDPASSGLTLSVRRSAPRLRAAPAPSNHRGHTPYARQTTTKRAKPHPVGRISKLPMSHQPRTHTDQVCTHWPASSSAACRNDC